MVLFSCPVVNLSNKPNLPYCLSFHFALTLRKPPRNQTFSWPQQPVPFVIPTSGNACSSTWESSSPGAKQSRAHGGRTQRLSHTSLNFICFSHLACCYFPCYTKANEKGRGEIRLLTAPRLTLHKIIHHDASPTAEQSHENSHLLQFS